MKHDAPLGSGNLYQVQLQWRGSDPIVGIARSQSGSRLVGRPADRSRSYQGKRFSIKREGFAEILS